MNVKTLQQMDRWLGVPLCFLFTVVRALFGRPASASSDPPRSILIVKFAEQGSTVLAYPALRRAVEMAGRERVYFIAFEENRFILDLMEVIPAENVITISSQSISSLMRSTLSALRRLRRLRLEAAVDMEFFCRSSAALTFLSGARRRVGFHACFSDGPYRGNLLTHRLVYNPHLHTSQVFVALVEAVRHDAARFPAYDWIPPGELEPPPPFVPRPEEVTQVKKTLGLEEGVPPPLILLNPNASDLLPLRRWPGERYVALARRLLERYPELRVAFTGAAAEAAVTAKMVGQVGSERCLCCAGKTTLRQLLVLYTLSEVLVTNDSGPSHFAALTPVRVVTLFGPETPVLFASRTPRNTVLWAGLACSPCVNAYNNRQSSCRQNLCLQAITVDQVFDAVCRAYEQKSETPGTRAG